MKIKYKITVLLFLLLSLNSFSQNEFFNEFETSTILSEKNDWIIQSSLNYKHAYQLNDWRRVGLDFSLNKKLNTNFSLISGLVHHYRFDDEIGNFFELRPWLGVHLSIPVIERLKFNQRFINEWRNFFLSQHDHYIRFRYKIGLNYWIMNSNSDEKSWNFDTSFEWYFLKDPVLNERYSNSREFAVKISKNLTHFDLGFGYVREVFLARSNDFGIAGNTILVFLDF